MNRSPSLEGQEEFGLQFIDMLFCYLMLDSVDLVNGYLVGAKYADKRSTIVCVLLSFVGMCVTASPADFEDWGMKHPSDSLDKFISAGGVRCEEQFNNSLFRVSSQAPDKEFDYKKAKEVQHIFTFPKPADLPVNLLPNPQDIMSVFNNLHYNVHVPMQILVATMMCCVKADVNKASEHYLITRHAPLIYSSVLDAYNIFGLQIPLQTAVKLNAPDIYNLLSSDPFASLQKELAEKYSSTVEKQFPSVPYASNHTEWFLVCCVVGAFEKLAKQGVKKKDLKKSEEDGSEEKEDEDEEEEDDDKNKFDPPLIEFGFNYGCIKNTKTKKKNDAESQEGAGKQKTTGKNFFGNRMQPLTAFFKQKLDVRMNQTKAFFHSLPWMFTLSCWKRKGEATVWADVSLLCCILMPDRFPYRTLERGWFPFFADSASCTIEFSQEIQWTSL
jgi:hypothetical protein